LSWTGIAACVPVIPLKHPEEIHVGKGNSGGVSRVCGVKLHEDGLGHTRECGGVSRPAIWMAGRLAGMVLTGSGIHRVFGVETLSFRTGRKPRSVKY